MRIGHAPPNAAQLAAVTLDGTRWELYELAERSTDDWRALKLIARAKRPKANYWLGWNGTRMSHGRDWTTLQVREPAVAAWLVLALEDRHTAALVYGGESSPLLGA